MQTDRHALVAAEMIAEVPQLTGNPLHDPHTASLMREHGVRAIYTRDTDFHRFPFLEVFDPLVAWPAGGRWTGRRLSGKLAGMELAGSEVLGRRPEEAFDHLLDPGLIGRCIPGCEELREVAPGVYETRVRGGAGPLHLSFHGRFRVHDVARGESYRIALEGKSGAGRLSGEALVRLAPVPAGSLLTYRGAVRVHGLAALMPGRALEAAAQRMLARFFEQLAAELSGPAT